MLKPALVILEQCGSDYLRKKTLVPPHHPPRFAAVKSVRAAARRISGGDVSNININLPPPAVLCGLYKITLHKFAIF